MIERLKTAGIVIGCAIVAVIAGYLASQAPTCPQLRYTVPGPTIGHTFKLYGC
jgi:hypothetical protein